MDPREVPGDQNFGAKILLIPVMNLFYEFIGLLTYAKNAKILKRRAIFYYFAL